MLSACFAEQHRAVRNAFCLDQCCSALVMGHCTLVCLRNIKRSLCSDTTMLSACFAEPLPGRCITLNRRSTGLSALQPCQEKKRKHETHKPEKRKSRRNTAGSTEYKARQDLDEGDADGAKLYNEYKRGELLVHGEDTYKKIKLDLTAMNEILHNNKECEPAPPRSKSSVKSPMEQYLTPLSDEETQASYQSWINQ